MSAIVGIILMLSWTPVTAIGHVLPPTGFKISVRRLGEIQLSWNPSVAPDSGLIKYFVKVQVPGEEMETYLTTHTISSRMLHLHKGVFAEVQAIFYKENRILSRSEPVSSELPPSSGAEGTAVTQLSCHIRTEESLYISLSCDWSPGDKAPPDTQYFMYYRYGDHTESCREYRTEVGGQRRSGCRVPSSPIDMRKRLKLPVLINGSSGSISIQSTDQVYTPEAMEILNPPRNLSVLELQGRTVLSWVKPLSQLHESCFQYQVRIWNLRSDSQMIENVPDPRFVRGAQQEPWDKHLLQVRAVGNKMCRKNELYSAWIEILYNGTQSRTSKEFVISISACLALAGLVSMLVCVRFHIFRKLFPRIPKPKDELKEIFSSPRDVLLCRPWGSEEVISSIELMGESDGSTTG